jgi:site-specific DNA recombinase
VKAILVARVSTEEQREAGNSLPAQLTRLQLYCERKGFIISETFSFDESAYKEKRDEFDKIINAIDRHKENVAICFDKVDRFSRNIFDKRVAVLYEKAIADRISLHFVSDGQVIDASISAGEKFAFGMKLGLSKYYSDAISDNVKRVFEQKRRNGEWMSKVRLGYLNIAHDAEKRLRKDIVIDPERSHLVVKLFELYATGSYSLHTIRRVITDLGLRTHKGKLLSRSQIDNILNDSFYYGTAYSKKYGHWEHKYPRLISLALFQKCQDIKNNRNTKVIKFAAQDYIFKGLLTCKHCGCSITVETKTKKSGKTYIYYSCTNGKEQCKRQYVSENELLKPIMSVLDRFENISEERKTEVIEGLNKNKEEEIAFHKNQYNRIRNEYEQLKEKDNRLLDLYLTPNSSITKETYDQKHAQFNAKLQQLGIELEEYTQGDFDYQTTLTYLFSVAQRAKTLFADSEVNEKRNFLKLILQNPQLDGKKLVFTIRTPFREVLKLGYCPVLLPWLDKYRTINWKVIRLGLDSLPEFQQCDDYKC